MQYLNTSSSAVEAILSKIKQHDIKFVDLRFVDLQGKIYQITFDSTMVDENFLVNGQLFDGSSIPFWQKTDNADMLLKPDCTRSFIDPFSAQPTLALFCYVLDPLTLEPYLKDSRNIAQFALNYLSQTQLADKVYFGPEPEFYIFDSMTVHNDYHHMSFQLSSNAFEHNHQVADTNLMNRVNKQLNYARSLPNDPFKDLRSDMLQNLKWFDIVPEKHHSEVGNAQHELGMRFDELMQSADNILNYKYTVKNTAIVYGKTACFMPKPMVTMAGSGMHIHLSFFKNDTNLFSGVNNELSETGLFAIGGILKHARALCGITNPTTNSYKRLTYGYEAPVNINYSAGNRTSAIRIPLTRTSKEKRFEVRFVDPSCNPYLALSALTMAAIDGIINKIHPDSISQAKGTLPTSLEEALYYLKTEGGFLYKGNVFTESFIETYLESKQKEISALRLTPHPVEFHQYYDI